MTPDERSIVTVKAPRSYSDALGHYWITLDVSPPVMVCRHCHLGQSDARASKPCKNKQL